MVIKILTTHMPFFRLFKFSVTNYQILGNKFFYQWLEMLPYQMALTDNIAKILIILSLNLLAFIIASAKIVYASLSLWANVRDVFMIFWSTRHIVMLLTFPLICCNLFGWNISGNLYHSLWPFIGSNRDLLGSIWQNDRLKGTCWPYH